ncbi:MAG: phospholipase D-like domain-containing protein [Rhodanobacteraceae bacterium]
MISWIPTLSLHALAVTTGLLIYVLTTRANHEIRAPSASIAWVFSIALIPYLALPLYFFFGRRKLTRPQRHVFAGSVSEQWSERMTAAFGFPPPSPARVRFHANGTEALEALHAVIDSAQTTLDVGTFLMGPDKVGREVATKIIEAQRRGVRVRVLIDGSGVLLKGRASVDALRDAGIDLRIFRPMFSLRLGGPRNLRNHRKVTIADRERLWLGGRNLAAEYFTGDGAPPWIDLSFDLSGPAAKVATAQFEADWDAALERAEHTSPPAWPVPDDAWRSPQDRVQFVPSGPDQSEDTVLSLIVAACFRAERRIVAVTPYFVPDVTFLQALRLAAIRGVAVDLIVPTRSNHQLADIARGRALRALARAGARVHLTAQMVHAKSIAFDDSLAYIGSANLDVRSLLLNYESVMLFYDEEQVRWIAGWLMQLAATAEDYKAVEPSLVRDVGEGLLLAFAFQA